MYMLVCYVKDDLRLSVWLLGSFGRVPSLGTCTSRRGHSARTSLKLYRCHRKMVDEAGESFSWSRRLLIALFWPTMLRTAVSPRDHKSYVSVRLLHVSSMRIERLDEIPHFVIRKMRRLR